MSGVSSTPNKTSPFSAGAIGAGTADVAVTTTRFWWVRHAPVAHDGRIYGQEDKTCDCTDETVFKGLARQLPRGTLRARGFTRQFFAVKNECCSIVRPRS